VYVNKGPEIRIYKWNRGDGSILQPPLTVYDNAFFKPPPEVDPTGSAGRCFRA